MPIKSHFSNQLIVVFGGLVALLLIAGSWLPQPCPLARQLLIGCPNQSFVVSQSPKAKELRRVPHQEIVTQQAFFSAHAQSSRSRTAVRFEYRPTTTHLPVYLDIKQGGVSKSIALISHPLLDTLQWHLIAGEHYSLYQLSPDFQSIDGLLANLPAKELLAVDQVVAEEAQLKPEQFTDLNSLRTFGAIKYILTSFTPSQPDGDWFQFDHTFDFTHADIDKDRINGDIFFPDSVATHEPFLLGEVHIDYQQPYIKP